jgi:hypothetical protein
MCEVKKGWSSEKKTANIRRREIVKKIILAPPVRAKKTAGSGGFLLQTI